MATNSDSYIFKGMNSRHDTLFDFKNRIQTAPRVAVLF